jgi:hypothetical protein
MNGNLCIAKNKAWQFGDVESPCRAMSGDGCLPRSLSHENADLNVRAVRAASSACFE